ncbi:MAG: type II toxin-antitoxin system VapC family toxin [Burkholderiales bacterium]
MSVTVLDASVVAAVLFDEAESEPILASVIGALIAPSLLPYELASVCTTKLIRRPREAKIILSRYRLFAELGVELTEPDWDTLPGLAHEWTLSAYDAAYLQLALAQDAPLITLDARLATAYDKITGKT